jgi:hypothetical protein
MVGQSVGQARESALEAAMVLSGGSSKALLLQHSGQPDGNWLVLMDSPVADETINKRFSRESSTMNKGSLALYCRGQILRIIIWCNQKTTECRYL